MNENKNSSHTASNINHKRIFSPIRLLMIQRLNMYRGLRPCFKLVAKRKIDEM